MQVRVFSNDATQVLADISGFESFNEIAALHTVGVSDFLYDSHLFF
jgi:hypothetical protein